MEGRWMIYEKMASRRTIRKYLQKDVPQEVLTKCVDAARLSPCAANLQPLRYVIINDKELRKDVFSTLKWAASVPEYRPNEKEMPAAYIVILLDKNIRKDVGHDAGIAAMSICMVASDAGLGSCILGSVDRERLREILNVPDNLDIIVVVSLGYAADKPVVDTVKNDDTRYWLDENKTLHVPKRSLESIVKWNRYQ
jgi:nitroreductase